MLRLGRVPRRAMDNVAQWKAWFDQYTDILLQVHTTGDIRRAEAEGKVGIFLGWQNTSGIEDRIDLLRVFKDLGVGVMQLTYNTQNLVGSGCWESRDAGLSDFGRDVIDEMNRIGILIDLSHVGAQTSEDAIRHSKRPVACYTSERIFLCSLASAPALIATRGAPRPLARKPRGRMAPPGA